MPRQRALLRRDRPYGAHPVDLLDLRDEEKVEVREIVVQRRRQAQLVVSLENGEHSSEHLR